MIKLFHGHLIGRRGRGICRVLHGGHEEGSREEKILAVPSLLFGRSYQFDFLIQQKAVTAMTGKMAKKSPQASLGTQISPSDLKAPIIR